MRKVLELPLKSLLALALVGAVPGAVAAQEQNASGGRQAQSSEQENENPEDTNSQDRSDREQKQQTRTLMAFDLEHANPQEILTLIQTISARQHQAEMSRQAKETSQRGRNAQQAQPTQVQFRPANANAQQNRVAVAVDQESKTLFVRGTEDQVSSVEKLVEMFDTEAGDLEKQELEGVTLVPVKQDRVQRINAVLGQLQLQTQSLRVGETALLILPDDEDQAKQVEQVIEKFKESNNSGQNDTSGQNDKQPQPRLEN